VRYRLMGDVPVGAFLSGGIDSSAVVACMSRLTGRPVRTFSIGFDSHSFDELPAAGIVARYFRTEHTVFLVRQDVAELLPALAKSFDEPFADPSAIPTFILARLARRRVKVVLTGVGGDESFAGHERYAANRLAMRMGVVANLLGSRAARAMLDAVAQGGTDDYRSRFKRFADQLGQSPGARNAGWLTQLGAPEKARLYDSDFAQEMRALDSRELLFERYREAGTEDFMDEVLYADMTGFLPDCVLVRNDIATMAHGLQSRSPLLDHRLVEFAARIPFELKLHRGRTQWILRRALRGLLPAAILQRPQRASHLPLDSWLRGALRETARELLLGARARRRGYFRRDSITRLVEEHESGRRNHQHEIWTLMMLELWHREYVDGAVTEAAVA
jgi:asparagine synthase (glutamine-hydrolysing)